MEISNLELEKVTEMLKNFTDKNGTIGERHILSTNCAGGRCLGTCLGSCRGTCQFRCKSGCLGACKGGCSGRTKRFF